MSGVVTINSSDLLNAIYPQLKPQITKEPEVAWQQYSYIIWTDGTNYYAKNGSTGEIDFSGTDATKVMQGAIDALRDTGGVIYVRKGTYNASISLYSNITIKGEGASTTIIGIISATGTSDSKLQKISIEDLHITGNSNGIVAHHVTQLRIKNVILDGALVDAISMKYVDQFEIDGCIIHGVKGNGIYLGGSNISDAANGVINNTWIYDAGANGIHIQYGDSIKVTNVVANNNTQNGIYVADSMNIFINKSVFDGNGDRGIYLNNVFSSYISDSYAGINHGPAGITLENCRTCAVSAIAVCNDKAGIYIYGGRNIILDKCMVLNNNVSNSSNSWEYAGIVIDNHASNIMINNTISINSTDYPYQNQACGIQNFNGTNIYVNLCILRPNTIAPLCGDTSAIVVSNSIT
jgi:hypothetical protein